MTRSFPPDPVELALGSSVPAGVVVAAVSGGPDSMAMFNALCLLAEKRGDIDVVAAHFDHALRADSRDDIKVVECVAERFEVRVITDRADVGAHARSTRQSIEAAARELRYAFLERAANEVGASTILTAHTHDDQAETLVMRMIRGAGTRGMRGIAEQRGRIVRPLLRVSRAHTVQHCLDYGVPFIEDPTNQDTRFFRNRVRHSVLPVLRSAHPDIDAVLDAISEKARGGYEEAERVTAERLGALRAGANATWCLPFPAFDGLDQAARVHLLMKVVRKIGTGDNVAKGHYAAILRLIDEGPMGKSVDLPEIRVRLEHDGLVFMYRLPDPLPPLESLPVGEPRRIGEWTLVANRVDGATARVEIEFLRKARAERAGDDTIAHVSGGAPLTVRFAREGDRMRPFGMTGHKKLSDLFIDARIPRRERWRTPVVESGGEIVWVVGVAVGEGARVHPGNGEVIRLAASRDRMTV